MDKTIPTIKDVVTVWTVWTNTDLTEGRGYSFVYAFCKTEATAKRFARGCGVMGSDGDITEEKAYLINGKWNSLILIKCPNEEDKKIDIQLQNKRDALAKAKSLGLTEEEIQALSNK